MKISLIIPTFNALKTVGRTLTSIPPSAPTEELEVIVVDDCSADGTKEFVNQIANCYPVKITSTKVNVGPGGARNIGIDMATGKWLMFLDSDDELAPNSLAKLSTHIDTICDSTDVIAFNWRYQSTSHTNHMQEIGNREDLQSIENNERTENTRSFLLNKIDQSAIFYAFRTEFIRTHNIRFRPGFHEDVDFTFIVLYLANKVSTLQEVLYLKWNEPLSIVNTLSIRHIHGYFDAIDKIASFLREKGTLGKFYQEFQTFLINTTASRLTRLLRSDIEKTETSQNLISALRQRATHSLRTLGVEADHARVFGTLETRYQKMFQLLVNSVTTDSDDADYDAFLKELGNINKMSWSCYDLQNSVFMAPNEIRTCCKRYYWKGQLKGDVVILSANDDAQVKFGLTEIQKAKNRLHHEINRNNATECDGCPFLQFADWGTPLQQGIKYLSLEYHSVCNMRCNYCSPVYFAGKKARYNVSELVESFRAERALDACEYIVWGGGEPTLDNNFSNIARQISDSAPNTRLRVITNCTRFVPYLAELIASDRAYIVVSIDAGSQALFQKIRRFKGHSRIIENLRRYAQRRPENIFIKYIVMNENRSKAEISEFVHTMAAARLLTSNFQISCDFRLESLTQVDIDAIAFLHAKLDAAGARFVFLDDLVWQRLPTIDKETIERVTQGLEDIWPDPSIAQSDSIPELIVWGTGAQARLMMEKSRLLHTSTIVTIVDPRPDVVNTTFLGHTVQHPDVIKTSNLPILIAAVQSAPFIYRSILELGVDENRVIRQLVL